MSEMLEWSTRWEYPYSWAPPQSLRPICAKYNELIALQWGYVNYTIFYLHNYKELMEIQRVSKSWSEQSMWEWRTYKNEIKIKLVCIKNNTIDVQAKFASEWQPLMRVNTLTCALNTTKTRPLPISTFFFPSHTNHLQIAHVRCL